MNCSLFYNISTMLKDSFGPSFQRAKGNYYGVKVPKHWKLKFNDLVYSDSIYLCKFLLTIFKLNYNRCSE